MTPFRFRKRKTLKIVYFENRLGNSFPCDQVPSRGGGYAIHDCLVMLVNKLIFKLSITFSLYVNPDLNAHSVLITYTVLSTHNLGWKHWLQWKNRRWINLSVHTTPICHILCIPLVRATICYCDGFTWSTRGYLKQHFFSVNISLYRPKTRQIYVENHLICRNKHAEWPSNSDWMILPILNGDAQNKALNLLLSTAHRKAV